MPKIKDVAMVIMLLSYFSRCWRTDGRDKDVRTYGKSRDNRFFLDDGFPDFLRSYSHARHEFAAGHLEVSRAFRSKISLSAGFVCKLDLCVMFMLCEGHVC